MTAGGQASTVTANVKNKSLVNIEHQIMCLILNFFCKIRPGFMSFINRQSPVKSPDIKT